jgi:cytochrome c553
MASLVDLDDVALDRVRAFLWGMVLAVPAAAFGQAPAAGGNSVSAGDKATQTAMTMCVACHGPGGNSTIAVNPNLAGLGADYIARQLHAFKSGVRVNAVMQAMVAPLSDEDMAALGTYYARQVPSAGSAAAAPSGAQAQSIYTSGDATTGLPACAACHGADGRGVTQYYPRLAGQHSEYLYAQLKAFKSGERGHDKGGRDAQGRIMWAVAQRLPELQMQPLAEYLSALRSAP